MKLEPLEEGLTNAIWRTDRGTVLKFVAPYSWTVKLINLFQLMFLHFEWITQDRRVANELRAKEVLEELDIRRPDVVWHDGHFIEMELVEGIPLLEHLADTDLQGCYEVGRAKGAELHRLHEYGAAYVDNRCGNTLVTEEGLASIDHELFREEAPPFLREFDLVTLTASAKMLEPRKYVFFIEGLHAGYDGIFEVDKGFRTMFTGVAVVGYVLLVKRSPGLVLRAWRNWVYDIRRHMRQLARYP
ncbi:MAG: hypothetical protein SV186_06510 [Candidatus Nanohaloarchaea archaeon]|nr:hypothetical protein [Candidatus Nanohaloarchaea archaeon]